MCLISFGFIFRMSSPTGEIMKKEKEKKQVKEEIGEKKKHSESDRKRTERKKKREQDRGRRYGDTIYLKAFT